MGLVSEQGTVGRCSPTETGCGGSEVQLMMSLSLDPYDASSLVASTTPVQLASGICLPGCAL
jgi:hypothetical protein